MLTLADVRSVLDRAAAELPAEALPDAIGAFAAAQARCWARLALPAPVPVPADSSGLLDAEAMASRLGMSVYWLREQATKRQAIPHHRAGRRLLFDPAEVIPAVKALGQAPRSTIRGAQDKRSWAHRRESGRNSKGLRARAMPLGAELP